MIIVCQNELHIVSFGKQFEFEDIICVVADAAEIDKSRCGCGFFFEYVASCWQKTIGKEPDNFIILEKRVMF